MSDLPRTKNEAIAMMFASRAAVLENESKLKLLKAQRQPLSDDEVKAAFGLHDEAHPWVSSFGRFEAGVRWAEKKHGIGGEE